MIINYIYSDNKRIKKIYDNCIFFFFVLKSIENQFQFILYSFFFLFFRNYVWKLFLWWLNQRLVSQTFAMTPYAFLLCHDWFSYSPNCFFIFLFESKLGAFFSILYVDQTCSPTHGSHHVLFNLFPTMSLFWLLFQSTKLLCYSPPFSPFFILFP